MPTACDLQKDDNSLHGSNIMDNFLPISEIISNVVVELRRKRIPGPWLSEPWGKSVWLVYSSQHLKILADGGGKQYPLVIYSMIRESNGIPTMWKTIEWRDTESREKPTTDNDKEIIGELQNKLSRVLHESRVGNFHIRSKFHHIDPISYHGMSRSSVMCELEYAADHIVRNDEHGWGLPAHVAADVTQEFSNFCQWGNYEITELLNSIDSR